MQNIVNGAVFTTTNGNIANAVGEYIQVKFKSYSIVQLIFYLYLFLVALWLIKLTKDYLQVTRHKMLHDLNRSIDSSSVHEIYEYVRKNHQAINLPYGKEGFTPFLRACHSGNTQVVKAMLELGADIKAQTLREENAFFLAIYNRVRNISDTDARCIQALYYAGVDMNKPNIDGVNSLQLAAMFGHTGLVHWLLNKDADLNVEPHPYLLAKRGGYADTAAILKRRRNGGY